MSDTARPTLREIATELLVEVAGLRKQVKLLDEGLRRSRRNLHIVVVSLVFDLVFSLAIFWLAHTNSTTLHQGCVAGNEIRADELSMWEGVFDVFPPPATEEGKAQVTAIRAMARDTFITRQC